MTGVLFVLGACWGCGRMFTFNPARVPSFRINAQGQPDPAGTREPICADCVDRFNRRRAAAGLDPIVPLPGAYEPFGPEDLDT